MAGSRAGCLAVRDFFCQYNRAESGLGVFLMCVMYRRYLIYTLRYSLRFHRRSAGGSIASRIIKALPPTAHTTSLRATPMASALAFTTRRNTPRNTQRATRCKDLATWSVIAATTLAVRTVWQALHVCQTVECTLLAVWCGAVSVSDALWS